MNISMGLMLPLHMLAAIVWVGLAVVVAMNAGGGGEKAFRWQMIAAVVAFATGAGLWNVYYGSRFEAAHKVLAFGIVCAISAAGGQRPTGVNRGRGAAHRRVIQRLVRKRSDLEASHLAVPQPGPAAERQHRPLAADVDREQARRARAEEALARVAELAWGGLGGGGWQAAGDWWWVHAVLLRGRREERAEWEGFGRTNRAALRLPNAQKRTQKPHLWCGPPLSV